MSDVRILTREELIDEVVQYLKDYEDVHAEALEELDSWCGYLDDDRWYNMDEFDELMFGCTPSEIAEKITEDFNINDNYFRFTIYGLESAYDKDYDGYDEMETLEALLDCYPRVNIWDDTLNTAVDALSDYFDKYCVNDETSEIQGIDKDDDE